MFLLAPPVPSNDSFTKTYKDLFEDKLINCFNTSGICNSEILFSMCIRATNETYNSTALECIFTRTTIQINCTTMGKWDKTHLEIYDECLIGYYLVRIDIVRYINLILVPLMIICITSAVFKLYEYNEICKEFHWKIIIVMLNTKVINMLVRFILTFLNSAEFVNHFCIGILITAVFNTYFCMSTFLVLFIYVYSIVNYTDIQLRVIRSSLKHIAVMSPFIMIFVEFTISVFFGTTNMFLCQYEPLLSFNRLVEIILGSILYIIMVSIRLSLYLKLHKTYSKTTLSHVFRIEYDILGDRIELTHRDLKRLFYILDWGLVFYGIFLGLEAITAGTKYVKIDTIYFLICVGVAGCNEILFAGFTIKLIWLNKNLKSLQQAIDIWHKTINTTDENEAEKFFTALKVADEDDDESINENFYRASWLNG